MLIELLNLVAHGSEEEAEEVAAGSASFLDTLSHQSAPVSLLLILFILFVIYTVLRFMKVNFLNRVLILIPVIVAISIFYLPHNAVVTSVTLSVGFVLTFLLVFTMLAGKPK